MSSSSLQEVPWPPIKKKILASDEYNLMGFDRPKTGWSVAYAVYIHASKYVCRSPCWAQSMFHTCAWTHCVYLCCSPPVPKPGPEEVEGVPETAARSLHARQPPVCLDPPSTLHILYMPIIWGSIYPQLKSQGGS